MRTSLRNVMVDRSIAGRYYQEGAIKATCDAFTRNRRKALLVMATGSGKTRTVIALCDVLLQHGWVKNILFLADRNSLVTQAKRSFVNLLPDLSVTNLCEEKDNYTAHCVFSTYQTMYNVIDSVQDENGKLFTCGHFDLVICDEAHRSVYNKYKDIFNYFDAPLVGLTATPKDEIDKNTYEIFELENGVPTYAEYHERQTTMDFHHQLKGAVLDAVDEGLIDRDPTRKAIIKGKAPSTKKIKYLNQFELHTLLASLELKDEVNWDYFILLVAKTGMRFSEALALTPKDFDFYHQTLSISKTWDYKGAGGFQPTKNKSSVRKIQIDWQSVIRFSELVKGLPDDQPIFVDGKVYNSTVNDVLSRHCERCNIPVISIHGLRHTHASLLLFTGVSIASVARRLGHSSMTTTQKTYLHIIQELENKDIDLVMRSLSGLNQNIDLWLMLICLM
ncbi:DEAD/DEAH box helicase family protein [Gemmiger sp.]|uniref:DEAD/DEAH box helicase family protein n=1 Tax=Gemmiger sp. TaxID=2049027 RepID=UPI003AB482AA